MHPGNTSGTAKDAKYDSYVLAILLLVILLLEFTIRAYEDKLSGDIEHIYNFPDIVSEMEDSPGSILFLGNSLSKDAYDTTVIDAMLASSPTSGLSRSFKLAPDGTSISDWYCIYRNIIAASKQSAPHIILSFAWNQLSDQTALNLSRLGGFFCASADIDGLAKAGLNTIESKLGFYTSMISHVYVNREAIRNRVLSSVIPRYERTTQYLNRISRERAVTETTGTMSFNLLEEFIDQLAADGARLTIVAMPVKHRYDLDPALLKLMSSRAVNFLDMRHSIELSRENYKDTMHLNKTGSAQFSELVTGRLLRTIDPLHDDVTRNPD